MRTDVFLVLNELKEILHKKNSRLNLIFWIVMGHGVAHFGRWGLKPITFLVLCLLYQSYLIKCREAKVLMCNFLTAAALNSDGTS